MLYSFELIITIINQVNQLLVTTAHLISMFLKFFSVKNNETCQILQREHFLNKCLWAASSTARFVSVVNYLGLL